MNIRGWIQVLFSLMLAFSGLLPSAVVAQGSLDVVVSYVEGAASETEIAYQVEAYVSVIDGSGLPVEDLTGEDFSVTEDGQPVELTGAELVQDQSISLILILDTSTSMVGQPMAAARQAAGAFVDQLNENDSVAVLSFNHVITTEIDFTTDHQAVQDQIARIDAVPSAGACLYDAAWQAVQMMATLPAGRRAIVLMTDGVDEYNGRPCSAITADDVIDAASGGGTRVPIYTIGLGERVDVQTLTRLSSLSGGRYLSSPARTQLEAAFLQVSDQLQKQYVLRYTSYAAAGAHTLAVKVEYEGAQDQDTRNFLLPAMPTRVLFQTPVSGQEVAGRQLVTVVVSGPTEPVAQVLLQANGETVASDLDEPYEMEVDFAAYEQGELTLTAIVQGAEEAELARTAIAVIVGAAPVEEAEEEETGLSRQTLIIGGVVLGAAVLAGLFFLLSGGRKKRRQARASQSGWEQTKTFEEAVVPTAAAKTTPPKQKTSTEVLGALIVEASDDPAMIGHRFEISHSPTTLGRSAGNDFGFPKDSPVSRNHAEIVQEGGALFLREIQPPDESGRLTGAKFGTFVDEAPVSGSVLLREGAVIRLGKRLRLRFEAMRPSSGEAKTMDDFDVQATADELPSAKPDSDATVEG